MPTTRAGRPPVHPHEGPQDVLGARRDDRAAAGRVGSVQSVFWRRQAAGQMLGGGKARHPVLSVRASGRGGGHPALPSRADSRGEKDGRRPAWQERLRDSYFERLFRECGLGGGGNIDGIWFDGDGALGAVVEIRNTRVEPLETYDPARYFKADCHTWIPCAQLARQLGVPLHLMTFEKDGARRLCGLATMAKVTTRRLFYHEGKAPCQRLVRTAEEASRYMLEERPIPIIARDPCLER